MAARERRERKHVERLGNYANDEALEELDLESAAEEEGSDVEEARGAVAKAARRGGGARAAPRQTAVTADMLSTLLAGAPALVDCLLLEDSVRSITLCCRDVVNLTLAAGGGVNLEPVWEALASRVKAKAAADAAAAAQQAAQAAEAGAAPEQLGNPGPGAPAAPAPAAAVPPAAAAAVPAPAAASEPEPAGRRTRRGRAKKAKPPPEPSALDVVKAAVAADPARSKDVRKTSASWVYKISAKAVHALPTHKGEWGKTLYCHELDVRTLAWRRWGDQAGMDTAKHRAEEQEQQRRQQHEQRLQEEKEARQEELAIRLAENGLPPDTAEAQINYRLRDWVRWGSASWDESLDELLAPIIQRHRERLEAEERARLRAERTKLLDDSLEAEGLAFFRGDWRYHCFVLSGEADGLEALLGTARRQLAAQQAEGERHRELAERLDAAGLEFYHSTSPMFAEWLKTGEGDVEAIVQQRRLRVDRECQLQHLLEINGLLHRQNSERCKKFVTGELLHRSGAPYTAKEVVSSLLASLGNEHTRCQELLDRLREERLPPVMHLSWCQTFVTAGGDLDAVIYQVKEYVYSRADVGVPPPGRPWAAAHDSTGAHVGIAARAPPAGLPTALCVLNNGHPVHVYNEIRPEGQTRVAFVCNVPPGASVTGLGVQLLDESGRPAAAVVAGELSVSWQDGWQDVTWDAPAAAASAPGSVIRLPSIQAPDAAGGMCHESIRFVSSSPPLDLSLAVCFKAGLPVLPSRPASVEAAECKDEAAAEDGKEGSRPLDLYWLEAAVEAAAEAAEALEEDAADRFAAEASKEAEDSSQRDDGPGSLAAGGAGSEQDAGPLLPAAIAAEPAVEAAATEAVPAAPAKNEAAAEAEAAAGAAVLADAEAAPSPVPLGAAAPGLLAAAEEPLASSPAAAPPAAAAAVREPAAAGSAEEQEQGTVDEMAVEAAAEQAAGGGETPFFSAEEAMAATAAKAQASQPREDGQAAAEQEHQDEDGPAAMQE